MTDGQRKHGERRRKKRGLTALIVIIALIAGIGAAGAALWPTYGDRALLALGLASNDYSGEGHGEATVTIAPGDIGGDVAASLADAGVVKTTEAFYELLLVQDPAVEFLPGIYTLRREMSAQAALDALQDPENRQELRALVPEGRTVAQALELVAVGSGIPLADLEAAAAESPQQFGLPAGVTSIEGWLYPATYEFPVDATAHDAIGMMINHQIALLDELGVAEADRERVLNIASIVEKEAGRAEDYGKVARVIFNRLDLDMMLQMDSTAQFGMGQHDDGSVWSSSEALSDDNPWNTYVHTGLPLTPIANPGRAAIEATLNPTPGDWIFFAAVNLETGESLFSETNEEHDLVVDQLRQWCSDHPSWEC